MEKKDIEINKYKIVMEEYSNILRKLYPSIFIIPLGILNPNIAYMGMGYLFITHFGNWMPLSMQFVRAENNLKNYITEDEMIKLKESYSIEKTVLDSIIPPQKCNNDDEVYYLTKREMSKKLKVSNLRVIAVIILLSTTFYFVNTGIFAVSMGALIAALINYAHNNNNFYKSEKKILEIKNKKNLTLERTK